MVKKNLVVTSILLSSALVPPLAHADQIDPFLQCGEITEDRKRLECFDAATQVVKRMALTQKDWAKARKKEKQDNFGKSQLRTSPVKAVAKKQKQAEEKDLKSVKLKVVDYAYTSSKKFVLFMDNGQIWKQRSGTKIRLPKGSFEVEIKKAALSGFNALVPTHKSIIKVKRLK